MSSSIKFAHSAHISPKGKPKSNTAQMWSMLTAGLACGFLGMYFTITRPMSERMEFLETDLAMMQSEMHQLVGTRDDLWKTNDLLSGLRQQQRQMGEAYQALAAMRQMKSEVIALVNDNDAAKDSIAQVAELQQTIIDTQASLNETRQAVADLKSLQQDVVALGGAMNKQREQIAASHETLAQVDELHKAVSQTGSTVDSAKSVVNAVDKLTGSMIARTDALAESTEVVHQIDGLHTQLTAQAGKLPQAEQTLSEMAALEDRLATRNPETSKQATANLAALTELETELSTGSEQITSALRTIELLEDFQSEMEHQAASLVEMRRDLMEITFLESTVEQTLNVLKPLIQLTDMRRMNDVEVREAARVIMDRRIADGRNRKGEPASRVAEREIPAPRIAPREKVEEQKVPTPIDVE